MAFSQAFNGISAYRQVGTAGSVEQADPHRLIGMLFDGALARIASAAGHIQRGAVAEKAVEIGKTLDIVGALRASLDMKAPGGLPQRLDALYEYIIGRLVSANLNNDEAILDEVAGLLRQVAGGWNAIAPVRTAGAA